MDPLFLSLAILASSIVLVKSADWIVDSIQKLARSTGVGRFKIAVIFIGLATSLPELVLGLTSAFSGVPALSLGNVVGANIADISLVLGLAGVFGGILYFKHVKSISREILFTLFIGLLPLLLLWDRGLSQIDGAVLLLFYIAYVFGVFDKFLGRAKEQSLDGSKAKNEGFWRILASNVLNGSGCARRQLLKLVGGALILGILTRFVVNFSVELSEVFDIPLFLIGLVAVSVGTTLPELAVAYRSIKRKEEASFLGNALGSVIANSTLILGAVAFISPLTIAFRREYLLSIVVLILSFFLLWVFVWRERQLNRVEASVLFLVYVAFIALEISGFDPITPLLK